MLDISIVLIGAMLMDVLKVTVGHVTGESSSGQIGTAGNVEFRSQPRCVARTSTTLLKIFRKCNGRVQISCTQTELTRRSKVSWAPHTLMDVLLMESSRNVNPGYDRTISLSHG